MQNYPYQYDVKCELERCKTFPIITDPERGEVYCGGCGLVLEKNMQDFSQDSRSFTQESFMTQTRTGPGLSLSMHDRGLSTVIGTNVDSTGHRISNKTKARFSRLRVWDTRSKSRSTGSLTKALIQLNAMKAKLGMPESLVEDAAYIYRKAVSAKLTRGRTMASLVSASIYAACRQANTPRTLDDIAKAGNVERRILSRDIRTLIKKLNLSLGQYDISSFIVKIANNLNLKEKSKRDGFEILKKAEEKMITAGKNPVAQAAASLYLAAILNGEKMSQRKFAEVAGVSDVTLRNRVAQIKKSLKLIN